jgi:hypothetical protein
MKIRVLDRLDICDAACRFELNKGGVKMTNTQNQGTNGLAIASFVTSLLGLTILGIIFGHISKSQIKQTGQGGSGLATAGLVIGYIFLAIQFFWILAIVGLAGA